MDMHPVAGGRLAHCVHRRFAATGVSCFFKQLAIVIDPFACRQPAQGRVI